MTTKHEGAGLSAPEEAALLLGEKADDETLLGLAFKELVARGCLLMEVVRAEPSFWGPTHDVAVTWGATPGAAKNAVLDAVLGELADAGPPLGGSLRDILEAEIGGRFRAAAADTPPRGWWTIAMASGVCAGNVGGG